MLIMSIRKGCSDSFFYWISPEDSFHVFLTLNISFQNKEAEEEVADVGVEDQDVVVAVDVEVVVTNNRMVAVMVDKVVIILVMVMETMAMMVVIMEVMVMVVTTATLQE